MEGLLAGDEVFEEFHWVRIVDVFVSPERVLDEVVVGSWTLYAVEDERPGLVRCGGDGAGWFGRHSGVDAFVEVHLWGSGDDDIGVERVVCCLLFAVSRCMKEWRLSCGVGEVKAHVRCA